MTGADIVVGSHAHRVQGGGRLGPAAVHYGLGNFLFKENSAEGARNGRLRGDRHRPAHRLVSVDPGPDLRERPSAARRAAAADGARDPGGSRWFRPGRAQPVPTSAPAPARLPDDQGRTPDPQLHLSGHPPRRALRAGGVHRRGRRGRRGRHRDGDGPLLPAAAAGTDRPRDVRGRTPPRGSGGPHEVRQAPGTLVTGVTYRHPRSWRRSSPASMSSRPGGPSWGSAPPGSTWSTRRSACRSRP